MNILGLSFMYHDSSATLLTDGEVVAAAAEERFSRQKHSLDFPSAAIAACLKLGGIGIRDVDAIVFYEKPLQKFERIVTMNALAFPRGFGQFSESMPLWLKYKLFVREMIRGETGYEGEILFADHHYAHASSAFFASPFDEAAILTMDGVGEWATMTRGAGRGNRIHLTHELRYPHSLGLWYSTFTAFLGFRVNGGEGKVMGLASYGEPRFRDKLLRDVIEVRDDGSFRMNLDYFAFHRDTVMFSRRFVDEFGPPRVPEGPITPRDEDLANSMQKVVEDVCLKAAAHLRKETGLRRLCIAGGVGLNSVTNGRILEEQDWDGIFIQPASGDDGGSLGSTLYLWHQVQGNPRRWSMKHAFLGPANDPDEIERFLKLRDMPYRRYGRFEDLRDRAAADLAAGRIVGWIQGRMEYGPRALGNRSILANPSVPDMKDVINLRVKHREPFRPFAPAVPLDRCAEFFDPPFESPYMLLVCRTRPDKVDVLRSITHVDGTARLQTVTPDQNRRFHDLIVAFGQRTGVPVLLNTSFNIRGEPIVCDYGDGLTCFLNEDMDCLAMEDCYLVKGPAPDGGGPRPVLPPDQWPL
jgi:carbamoyltransferase